MAGTIRGSLTIAWRQAAWLAALAIGLAVALWIVRPDRLPLRADAETYALDLPVPQVAVAAAREFYDAGDHIFVDTRAGDPAGRPAIPGAFVIRANSFGDDLAGVMDFIYPEDSLVLYGERSPLPVAAVAARFLERGYENVVILQGGLDAWRRGGGPLDERGVSP
ncbi:MAG TPA: rhodanese-like domain-containing protein [Candidatus Krumholzibacteria bacterium]|nr:rhodanese-like domain-containing protein [Candidatus Krumholzibacteria bacterium]HPD72438.1 rhodanese-like domain-containing protein [Candidatus Krumholzibacteria bacterium]HRY40630.1 rhodanese-like domain-containing protein [Candidatus Krumholzibacteria bacterium]